MNHFQIRFADSGFSEEIAISTDQSVSTLQLKIKQRHRIQLHDQKLLTKSGALLHPQSKLAEINQQLQKTIVAQKPTNGMKQIHCLYLYNDSVLKNNEVSKPFNEEQCLREIQEKVNKFQSLKETVQFRSVRDSKSKEQLSRLRQANENIVQISQFILEHYEDVNNQHFLYKQTRHQMTIIHQQTQILSKSSNLLFKRLGMVCEGLQTKALNLQNKLTNLGSRLEVNVKQVEEMKNSPLHQKLQQEKQFKNKSKYDIFFSETKIQQTEKRTRNIILAFKKEGDKLISQISNYKDKLGNKKKTNRQKVKAMEKKISERQGQNGESDLKADEIKADAKQVCTTMFEFMERYLRNPEDTEAKNYLFRLGQFADQYSTNIRKDIEYIKEWINRIRINIVNLLRQRITFMNLVKDTYKYSQKTFGWIQSISKEIQKIQKQQKSVTKQIQNSFCAKQVEEAYQASLHEVSRRWLYFHKIQKIFLQLKNLQEEQIEKRKRYNSHRKKYKSPEFILGLASLQCPQIKIQYFNDNKLPKIEFEKDQHGESPDEYCQKENQQLKKQITKLRERICKLQKQENITPQGLQELNKLMTEINSYKKQKQNGDPNRGETKIKNLEEILIKTAKISYNLYTNKLKIETNRHNVAIELLEKEIQKAKEENQKLKEQNRQFKHRFDKKAEEALKLQAELNDLKQRSKKYKSELQEQFKPKEQQIKSLIGDMSKLKEQMNKKDEQLRGLAQQTKELQRNIRYLTEEKQTIINENKLINIQKQKWIQERLQYQNHIQKNQILNKQYKQQLARLERQLFQNNDIAQSKQILENQVNELLYQNRKIRQINQDIQMQLKQKEQSIRQLNEHYKVPYESTVDELQEKQRTIAELKNIVTVNTLEFIKKQHKQEVEQESRHDIEELRQQNDSLRGHNQRLQNQIAHLENELNLIIMKQTEDIQIQTDEENSVLQFHLLQKNKKILFIPYSQGIYRPMLLSQQTQVNHIGVCSYRQNYFLDLTNIENRYKQLLNENGLLLISTITDWQVKYANIDENPYNLKINQKYYDLRIAKPEYIIGFEDEDHSIKNYAHINNK